MSLGVPSSIKIYDADQVLISFAGISLSAGYADGEFVKIARLSESFGLKVGTDGEAVRSKTNNRSAKITLRLMQSSSVNDVLSQIHNNDLTLPGGAGVGVFRIQDLQGTTLHQANAAWISKWPDESEAREASEREWEFSTGRLDNFIGGNLVVG